MQQRTDEWMQARLGQITASRLGKLVARTKSGPSASRRNLIVELALERVTGQQAQGFVNAAMQHGIDTESTARAMYEAHTSAIVTEVGYAPHPTICGTGASPDGLVGTDGLIEIKCPDQATHLDTLRGAEIKRDYLLQMQWQMACTGRNWCDFVSFDDRFPESAQLHIRRVQRDEKLIAEITSEVESALIEIESEVAFIHNYKEAA